MKRTIDAERTLTVLAKLLAEQNGQSITSLSITRRGSNEENNNINNSAGNSI